MDRGSVTEIGVEAEGRSAVSGCGVTTITWASSPSPLDTRALRRTSPIYAADGRTTRTFRHVCHIASSSTVSPSRRTRKYVNRPSLNGHRSTDDLPATVAVDDHVSWPKVEGIDVPNPTDREHAFVT